MIEEKKTRAKKYFLLYLILPVILDLIIESLNRKSLLAGVQYMVEKPSLFLFNVLIIILTLSIALFFKREIFVLSLISIIWLLFSVVNFVILHFRVTPFSAVDFTLISSAISVSGHYLTALNIAMILLAVVILAVAIVCLFKKAPRTKKAKGMRPYVAAGVVVITVAAAIYVYRASNVSVQALADNYTNISEAYENYGFVYCFANSLIDTGISRPNDYSQESVRAIQEQLTEEKNTCRKKPDIVMVQLESFFDVDTVKELKFSEDPLPNFHRLQKEYTDGQLTVPTVGAGTVNTEFEVLTGMSQHDFGVSEYPYKTKLKNSTSESICQDLAQLGYTSHAVHNNTATFYGRNKVFSNLGFDTFTSVEYMNHIRMNPNGWAKDDVMTDEIIKTLDETDGPAFTFGITVQSHGKYEGVDDSGQKQDITVTGAPEGQEDAYQYYVNEIHEVDQMIGALVEKLQQRKKPTILVLYGDHLPSLNLEAQDLTGGSLYQTQYVIWNNYGLKQQDQDLTAYQLYSTMLDQAGIHNGLITRYHQQTDWSSKGYQDGLKTLEYDLLYGENYAYDVENPFEATKLKMGTDPIRIRDIVKSGDGYIIKGSGFTPYCVVSLDGDALDTTWLSENELQVQGELALKEPDEEKDNVSQEKINQFTVGVENGDGVTLSEDDTIDWLDTSACRFKNRQ
mgnify:CR=1 FL=1